MHKNIITRIGILVVFTPFICHAPNIPYRGYYAILAKIVEHSRSGKFDTYIHTAFPPRDDIRPLICGLIEEETERIDIAMFQLTDKELTQPILNAYRRGVRVHLVVDRGINHYSQVLDLHKAGVSLFTFPTAESERRDALMHNKYMVLHSLYCVITGSMNFTQAGTKRNQENVITIQDKDIFHNYAHHFEYLMNISAKL